MSDNRTGGSYAVIDNVLTQVEAPTADHPEGNRPRSADGKPLDANGRPMDTPVENTAAADTAEKPRGLFRRTAAE